MDGQELRPKEKMSSEVEKSVRRELAKEKAKSVIPTINKDTLIVAASAAAAVVGGWIGGKLLADKLTPLLSSGESAPEIFEVNPQIDEKDITFGACQEYGRAFRNELGDVYLCADGTWTLALPDSGILVDDDGRAYIRADEIPGAVPETYRFSHWAGDPYYDQELKQMATKACYSTADGLGCDIRYTIAPTPTP